MVQKGGSSMNLPRNIVQIGEPDKYHKIFIEDYVLSYIKQSIRKNRETLSAYGRSGPKMALYGEVQEENDVTYYFLYAAATLTDVSEQEHYLSQEERKEAEELRLRFFPDYKLRAFCILKEELPDGFYVLEGLKGRFIHGYACFYEKNDNMLSYMLYQKEIQKAANAAKAEKQPEKKPQEKLLKRTAVEHRKLPIKELKLSVKNFTAAARTGAIWVFIVLCIIGILAINDADKLKRWKDVVAKGFESIGEQKLPDKGAVELKEPSMQAGSDNVVSDVSDSQMQYLVSENRIVIDAEKTPDVQVTPQTPEMPAVPETPPVEQTPETPEQTTPVQAEPKEPEKYVITRGDTLLSISREKYGTVEMVKQICELNQITDPNNIQVGQTILLP